MATIQATAKSGSGYQAQIGNVTQSVSAVWAFTGSTVLALNDVLAGPVVPAGARIVGVRLAASDCDSGTTLTMSVGDTGSTARFISASTIGQAGGVTTTMVAAGVGYKYTAATQINVLIAAAATGAGAATEQVCLTVEYIVEEATS